MVVSIAHENPNRTLAQLVEIVAEETERDLHHAGSTTFKRKDLAKGFEPDSCFYIGHAEQARGREELDPMMDPPPDLVIEIDITRSSLNRFPIFAALGVPEVWRFDGERVTMYRLESGRYLEIETSLSVPPLTASQSTVFLDESRVERKARCGSGVFGNGCALQPTPGHEPDCYRPAAGACWRAPTTYRLARVNRTV